MISRIVLGLLGLAGLACIFVGVAVPNSSILGAILMALTIIGGDLIDADRDRRKVAEFQHTVFATQAQALEARLQAVDGLLEELAKATIAHQKVVEDQLRALCEMSRDRGE